MTVTQSPLHFVQAPLSRPLSSWGLVSRAPPPWLRSTRPGRSSTSSCQNPFSLPPRPAVTPLSLADQPTSVPPLPSCWAPPPARPTGCRSRRCPPSLAPLPRWGEASVNVQMVNTRSTKYQALNVNFSPQLDHFGTIQDPQNTGIL